MPRYIDADELVHMLKTDFDTLYETIFDTIRRVPTVDAVPVVRCKECKHTLKGHNGALVCCLTKMVGTTDPNWFCADGERKDDG